MWVTIKLFLATIGVLLVIGCGLGGNDSSTDDDSGVGASSELTPGNGAMLVVNSTADGDERDDELTLREAIALATGQLSNDELTEQERDRVEGNPGADSSDVITFDEGMFDPEEPATISLRSTFPSLSTGGDIIDGGGGVVIEGLARFDCFVVQSDGNVIAGLQIYECDTAITLSHDADRNTMGAYRERGGNVLSSNYVGIEIRGSVNAVRGNLIGTDASGTEAEPNTAEGIWVAPGATGNLIGGSDQEARNVISGNALFGISIDGSGTTGNLVIGNYIGIDITGQAPLGNKYGITIQAGAQDNVVGGETEGEANVITANNTGVLVRGPETRMNTVFGNYTRVFPWAAEDWLENVRGIWVTDGAKGNIVDKGEQLVLTETAEK